MEKGCKLTVTGVTHDGRGVARMDGKVVFVAGALPGDEVLARITRETPRFSEAETEEILSPSPDRVAHACRNAGVCGGCPYRLLRYEKQLAIKESRVKNAFRRIGGLEIEPLPILPSPKTEHYRNKITLRFAREGEGIILGTVPENSHKVLPRQDCDCFDARLNAAVEAVERWASVARVTLFEEEPGKGLLSRASFRVGSSGECSVVFYTGEGDFPKLPLLHELAAPAGVVAAWRVREQAQGKVQVLWGEQGIAERLAGVDLLVSPVAFLQVNHEAAERLYETAAEFADLKKTETVADLCCGVGSITLMLARKAGRAFGAEISRAAVADAERNARRNGVCAEFVAADAGEALAAWLERGEKFDCIVADPPRTGLTPGARRAILKAAPARVVYISCDPETLARDCAEFSAGGYRVEKVQPVDLFANTSHVETVVLLSRKENNL